MWTSTIRSLHRENKYRCKLLNERKMPNEKIPPLWRFFYLCRSAVQPETVISAILMIQHNIG